MSEYKLSIDTGRKVTTFSLSIIEHRIIMMVLNKLQDNCYCEKCSKPLDFDLRIHCKECN